VVPHRKALQLTALVALSRQDPPASAAETVEKLRCRFPMDLALFCDREIFPELPIALAASLMVTDAALAEPDPKPFQDAAWILDLSSLLSWDPLPSIRLPSDIWTWREHPSLRMFFECCLLAGIAPDIIIADVRQLWGLQVDEHSLKTFSDLFCARDQDWLMYEQCLPPEEATFKRALRHQPADVVRWRLGVPVSLDTTRVLDRLISDAYYTERLIKVEAGGMGVHLSKTLMDRVKLERETILKGVDRRLKLAQAERAKGSLGDEELQIMRKQMENMDVELPPLPTLPLVSDLAADEAK